MHGPRARLQAAIAGHHPAGAIHDRSPALAARPPALRRRHRRRRQRARRRHDRIHADRGVGRPRSLLHDGGHPLHRGVRGGPAAVGCRAVVHHRSYPRRGGDPGLRARGARRTHHGGAEAAAEKENPAHEEPHHRLRFRKNGAAGGCRPQAACERGVRYRNDLGRRSVGDPRGSGGRSRGTPRSKRPSNRPGYDGRQRSWPFSLTTGTTCRSP